MKLDHDEADTDVPHFPGQADGTFSCLSALPTLARMLVTPSYPTAAVLPVAADFTGDGFKDLLLVGFESSSVRNNNQPEWATLVGGPKASSNCSSGILPCWSGAPTTVPDFIVGMYGEVTGLAASDVNGDGKPDVTMSFYFIDLETSTEVPHTVTWYGKGDGTFLKTPPP